MEPSIGHRFKIREYQFEIIDKDDSKFVAVKINPDGTKTTFKKNFPRSQWPPEGYSEDETVDNDKSSSKKHKNDEGSLYTIEVDQEGNLSIKNSKGFEVTSSNIKGPRGGKGELGPQGPQGLPGEDGVSSFPRVTEDGENIFFVDGDGKRISDNYPIKGKSGDNGSPGLQGEPGPKGKDGIYWQPVISSDSKSLRFVDANDESNVTPWYPIQGAKGDTGSEGPHGPQGQPGAVFIPSVNSDGLLSWSNNGEGLTNPKPVNIKGEKGDTGDAGVTYQPVIKDGVLYWYDEKGLASNISPVKISGKQGDRGDVGPQGLSAYEIWLKQGYRGTEQDFLDSLKGEKGTPAPPANFSFKDVEDFTCKIQKIDTDLIVDSETPTESPEEIIESRIEEIKKLREEGHKKENQAKNRVGWFKKFTWWCAGVDRDLLTMCPSDHAKYAGVGTVILFTALMAWFSSFIAIQLVFDPTTFYINTENGVKEISVPIIPIVFATIWAAMIFFLDRFITNTMYSDGKVTISKQELICGLPRIVIAIFLGVVISAPLELKIFDQEICDIIATENVEKSKEYANIEREYHALENDISSQISSFEKDNKPDQKNITKTIKVNKPGTGKRQFSGYDTKGNPIYTHPTILLPTDSVVMDVDKYNELNKQYKTEIRQFSDSLNKCLKNYANSIDQKKEAIKDSIKIEYANNKFGLYEHLSALHKIAMKDYKEWEWCGSSFDCILHAWWWYLFNSAIGLIMLLFILIDISPVLYKMMLADGKYDNYLHQEKLLAQDKIRLSLSKMLKKLDEGELKRVAPFIMGDIYEKMAGDSYVFKTEKEFKDEIKEQKDTGWWWRIWPFSFFRWLFYKEQDRPTAPVIILDRKAPTDEQEKIKSVNNEVFEEVLDMKKKLVLASYRRWYKTQHDCIICDDVDDENKGQEPFDDEDIDSKGERVHVDGDESDTTSSYEYTQDTSEDDSEDNTSEDSNNDSEEENPQSEDENSSQNTSDSNDDDEEATIDEDEHECPEDDGDDNINNKK